MTRAPAPSPPGNFHAYSALMPRSEDLRYDCWGNKGSSFGCTAGSESDGPLLSGWQLATSGYPASVAKRLFTLADAVSGSWTWNQAPKSKPL